jgi:mRNA interferase MazF
MREGSVVIAVLPQADGEVKPRPAVVLRVLPGYGDLLLCGISTRLYQMVKDFDEIIFQSDADFVKTGLYSDSLIRLGHLFALPKKFIEGEIGLISPKRHKRMLKTLSSYLAKKKK